MKSSFSSDPKQRSETSTVMTVHTRGIHNYPKEILFLVIELAGYGEEHEGVPLSPHANQSAEERGELPLHARRDAAVTTVWFAEPWPARTNKVFSLEIPTDFAVMRELKTLAYYSYVVGHEPKDALRLLGDPLLTEDMRKGLALRVSKALGRRHRYLDDKSSWSFPEDPSLTMAGVPEAEQAEPDVLVDAGATAQGTQVLVRNGTERIGYVLTVGSGGREWWKIDAKQERLLAPKPGLLAFTTWDGRYVTHTVFVRTERRYTFDFQ